MIDILLMILYALFSFSLLLYGLNCLLMIYASNKYKSVDIKEGISNYPYVTVQLPIYNERYVVHRLIEAVCSLDWPKDKLQILVLDDSTDDTSQLIDKEVEAQRRRGIDISVIRRERRTGFKAGALQNALKFTRGKYIAVFDADFIPPRDFLKRTVPILEEDATLGFIQARWGHINRNYNLLTKTIAIGIDGHHIIEQAGRNALGFFINFNGSCGILRTKAIMDVGGWSWDTLSEDLDISYRMQMKGWRGLYLRDLVVPGEIPPNMPAFRNQQARWARGSIQCARKLLPSILFSPFPILKKIQATIHLTYYMVHLFMLSQLLIIVPLTYFKINPLLKHMTPLFGLYFICAISPSLMYYEAIKYQKISFKEMLPYLGLLAIIGYGLSVQCSIELIKGLIHYGGDFERTPKYDIKNDHDKWSDKRYKPLRRTTFLEYILSIYSLIGVLLSLRSGLIVLSFYLCVYFLSYLYMGLCTDLHYRRIYNYN